jgi:hypothetical protein
MIKSGTNIYKLLRENIFKPQNKCVFNFIFFTIGLLLYSYQNYAVFFEIVYFFIIAFSSNYISYSLHLSTLLLPSTVLGTSVLAFFITTSHFTNKLELFMTKISYYRTTVKNATERGFLKKYCVMPPRSFLSYSEVITFAMITRIIAMRYEFF